MGLLVDFIAETWGPKAVEPFLTYFMAAFEPRCALRGILLESVSKETRNLYATIRDQLIAEGKAKGIREGKAEGKAEGMAEGMVQMLMRLLDTRGLVLTSDLRERVAGCEDEGLLQRWFDRSMTATKLNEVFDD